MLEDGKSSSFYLKSRAGVAPATNASRSGGAEVAKSLQKWKLKLPEQKRTAEVVYVLHKWYHRSDLLLRRCGNRVTFRNLEDPGTSCPRR